MRDEHGVSGFSRTCSGFGRIIEENNMRLRSTPMFATAAVFAAATAFAGQAAETKAALKNPAALTEQAPPTYKAAFDTSAGKFVITVHRTWAPNGADRFY